MCCKYSFRRLSWDIPDPKIQQRWKNKSGLCPKISLPLYIGRTSHLPLSDSSLHQSAHPFFFPLVGSCFQTHSQCRTDAHLSDIIIKIGLLSPGLSPLTSPFDSSRWNFYQFWPVHFFPLSLFLSFSFLPVFVLFRRSSSSFSPSLVLSRRPCFLSIFGSASSQNYTEKGNAR